MVKSQKTEDNGFVTAQCSKGKYNEAKTQNDAKKGNPITK